MTLLEAAYFYIDYRDLIAELAQLELTENVRAMLVPQEILS